MRKPWRGFGPRGGVFVIVSIDGFTAEGGKAAAVRSFHSAFLGKAGDW